MYYLTVHVAYADMFIMVCVPFVCVTYTNKTRSGPRIKSPLQMLLHLQILLALVCLVSLGWKGYTQALSLLIGRNLFFDFELLTPFPLFVSAFKKIVCISALGTYLNAKFF